MSITTTYCPSCGQSIEAEPGSFCARCQAQAPINVNFESPARAQLSYHAEIEKPGSAWLDLLWAFLIWGVSGAFLLGLDALLRLALYLLGKEIPKFEITRGAAIFTIAITLVLQLVALGASWMFVTRLGRKPFLKTLGWHWHPQFHWWQATVLALVMFGVAIVISKVLPHHETDMDKILKMGFVIRLMVATLAVLVAPLVEEVVYRGVVYSAVERLGGKVAGVIAVTGIFALVHVPQYWGSFAAITAILALSFVLTLVRSWTGSLLPCVMIHLVFNGIQGVALVVAPEAALDAPTQKAAIVLIASWLGIA